MDSDPIIVRFYIANLSLRKPGLFLFEWLELADSARTACCQKAATRCATAWRGLDFRLLRNLQSVIHLDAEVSDRAFQLRMAKQELNGSQVLRTFVDQRNVLTGNAEVGSDIDTFVAEVVGDGQTLVSV